MQFKIDTKTNHRLITVAVDVLDDKLADEMDLICAEYAGVPPGNLLFVFPQDGQCASGFLEKIAKVHEQVQAKGRSLALAITSEDLYHQIINNAASEGLNIAPSLPEAVDIIGMEIIERELRDDENV